MSRSRGLGGNRRSRARIGFVDLGSRLALLLVLCRRAGRVLLGLGRMGAVFGQSYFVRGRFCSLGRGFLGSA